jgi:S-methylmethionine-dependent homocysteine/selenocysteine methylase
VAIPTSSPGVVRLRPEMPYRNSLPQASGATCITDGGMETTLIFHQGLELPLFASFPLLATKEGTEALRTYFAAYAAIARDRGIGLVLDAPTWRANAAWCEQLGYSADDLAEVNSKAVAFMEQVRAEHEAPGTPIVISGCVGPRDDAYRPGTLMSATEAERYHSAQIATLAETAADLVSGLTLAYTEEAIGIARAAERAELPVVISFTVETDGRLPSGMALREAIERVDAETGGAVSYFMINCAHPTHFTGVLEDGEAWLERIGGVRANASTKSHAELDEAEELDEGDPAELAGQYQALRTRMPGVSVVGGCCGTDDRHVAAIADAWLAAA